MATWDSCIRGGGLLIVLSGPSGVGKDAVLAELEDIRQSVSRCVTATTRPRRDYEQDGVDYTFVSTEEFNRRIQQGDFLEYAEVHGHHYGTPKQWVEVNRAQGADVVLKIDVQGGLTVKRAVPETVMVFLVPPSMDELEHRLRSRNTDSEESIARRLANARKELDCIPDYEYIIENGSLALAAEELKAVIIAEHCRVAK